MFLIPFLSGGLALINPGLALILLMFYAAKVLGPALVSPYRTLLGFFILPLVFLAVSSEDAASMMVSMDAIFGAGLIVYIFLITLRRNQTLTEAFLASAIMLMIYTIVRMILFKNILNSSLQEGMNQIMQMMPGLESIDGYDLSMKIWQQFFPAFWGIMQIFALLLGFLLFHRMINLSISDVTFRFPVLYNVLILAILPWCLQQTYLTYFISALSLLLTIPLIQGFFALWGWLSRVLSSNIIKGIIMIFVLIYAFIPLTIYGYANSWVSSINKKDSGETHESNIA
ncbi:MAG: hypothetical protein LHW60_06745 [Candidatus Cloacimonetes bacterium]|jgi:hypothetical protein|nr:hypothetical protein [Candidatus Cloacimonadota bacterium]NLO43920.1 hypothetical protein [Candidatus Cloacimonadota bacterium]